MTILRSRSVLPWSLLLMVALVGCGDSGEDNSTTPGGGAGGKGGAAGAGAAGAGQGGSISLAGHGGAGTGGNAGKSQGGSAGSAGGGATCGNGKKEGAEQCDGKELGGATCPTLTKDPKATGDVTCNTNCTLDGSGCKLSAGGSGGSGGASTCGNGKLDAGEACEGSNLNGETCATVTGDPKATGTVSCNTNCTLDGSKCKLGAGGSGGSGGSGNTLCGNGNLDSGEVCDGANVNKQTCATVLKMPSATGALGCFDNCTYDLSGCKLGSGGAGGGGAGGSGGSTALPKCGDGIKNNSELCDGTDFGVITCATVLAAPGSTGSLICNSNCTLNAKSCKLPPGGTGGAPSCGDGVKEGGEPCDGKDLGGITCAAALGDPKSAGTVLCRTNCTLDLSGCSAPGSGGTTGSACGDGKKNGAEQCDKSDLGLATCKTVLGSTATGTLSCNANCTLNPSACVLGSAGSGGASGASGAGGTSGAGGAGACVTHQCQGHQYLCGDCIDNDGDGKVDMEDPDCLGPCHNNESGYFPDIPGANNAPCKQDCYYDQDSGSGNDQCYWDQTCDPKATAPNFYPGGNKCPYDPDGSVTSQLTCDEAYDKQSDACTSFCGPLTPNGCDCFGCCELPAGTGKYVYVGTTEGDSGKVGTCDLKDVNDPEKCHPCTPVKACLNTCEKCEICLGKPTLPPECTPTSNVCGDGKKGGAEQCDGSNLGTATCASITGIPGATGTLSCYANCTLNAGACKVPNTTPVCGDGIISGAEQCDGKAINGVTCAELTGNPKSTGTVTCSTNCTLNGGGCTNPTDGTPFCGDGMKNDTHEQCDGKDVGGVTCATLTGDPKATGTVACSANCTLNGGGCSVPPPGTGGAGGTSGSCGDGTKNGAEQCDKTDFDGVDCKTVLGNPNATGTIACFSNCLLDTSDCTVPGGNQPPPACGNGTREGTEQCDKTDFDGATCASVLGNPAATGTLACFSNCVIDPSKCTITTGGGSATCGNGKKEGAEQCDLKDFGGQTCASVLANPNATGTLACFGNCLIDASGCKIPTPPPPGCGGQVCPDGRIPCGLDCQDPCPINSYCLTGCCVPEIQLPTAWVSCRSPSSGAAARRCVGRRRRLRSPSSGAAARRPLRGFLATAPRWGQRPDGPCGAFLPQPLVGGSGPTPRPLPAGIGLPLGGGGGPTLP